MSAEKLERFGTMLVEGEIITKEQWSEVLDRAAGADKPVESLLIEMKLIDEGQLGELLEFYYRVPYVKLDEFIISMEALHKVPENIARQHGFIPMSVTGREMTVAMADPDDVVAIDTLKYIYKDGPVKIVYATREEIERAIRTYYGAGDSFEDTLRQITRKSSEVRKGAASEDKALESLSGETPVVQLVNRILEAAVEQGASDIHFEPTDRKAIVRFRIDGILHIFLTLPLMTYPSIISRLKIMNTMNIAERRHPQDGRAQIRVKERAVDLRASTFPVIFGEKMVLRILDKSTALANLDKLGFTEENYRVFADLISQPYGMVLVTGPTGSGKSTTLFATLNRLKSIHRNIVSVEDPVEYQVDLVSQAQVNPRAGLDFASSLMYILRQDPDVIMVGEIRDRQTAEMAVQAAMTGHLVLSTLHTNDAVSAVTRLVEMGLPRYLISSVLSGVMAQRLLRCICLQCRQSISADIKVWRNVFGTEDMPAVLYRGRGCPACHGTGYSRRVAVSEVFRMTPDIANLIMEGAGLGRLVEAVRTHGLRSLRDDAKVKVLQGITTIDEVLRTTLKE
jgi:type IV pilus assembly protein PilB